MQVAVIGLGNFGVSVARTLMHLGTQVLAIDEDLNLVEEVKDLVTQATACDATDESALREAGVTDMDAAVVAIGEDIEASIMCTRLLRRMGLTNILCRALSDLHEEILKEVGASRIIRIEELMGEQAAKWLTAPHVYQHVTFASGYTLIEMRPPAAFVGKTLMGIDLRKNYQVNIAAIQKREPAVDENGRSVFKVKTHTPPDPNSIIESDDILVVVGEENKILEIMERK